MLLVMLEDVLRDDADALVVMIQGIQIKIMATAVSGSQALGSMPFAATCFAKIVRWYSTENRRTLPSAMASLIM